METIEDPLLLAAGTPGPRSSTVNVPPSTTTSIGRPLWSNLQALSTRLVIARSSDDFGASTTALLRTSTTTSRERRRPTRSATSAASTGRSIRSLGCSSSSPEATATSSLTSSVSSVTSVSRSSSTPSRMSDDISGCRRSTDRLVFKLVSGVRSSCPASCTSRRCSARETASAPSMLRKAEPSRPTSSVPTPGTSTSSRPDEPTSSAAPVSRRMGAATVPAISQPTRAAPTETSTTSRRVRWRRSASTLSTSSSGRATCKAPSARPMVWTRYDSSPTSIVSQLRARWLPTTDVAPSAIGAPSGNDDAIDSPVTSSTRTEYTSSRLRVGIVMRPSTARPII